MVRHSRVLQRSHISATPRHATPGIYRHVVISFYVRRSRGGGDKKFCHNESSFIVIYYYIIVASQRAESRFYTVQAIE